MPRKQTDFVRVLRALNEQDARYVIIGGLALQLLGGDHFTFDIDLAISTKKEELRRIVKALAPFKPRRALFLMTSRLFGMPKLCSTGEPRHLKHWPVT